MKKGIGFLFVMVLVTSLLCGSAAAGEDGNQKANAAVVGLWELSTPLGVYAVARFAPDGSIVQINLDGNDTSNHMMGAIGEWRRCTEAPCTTANTNRFEFVLYMYDLQTGLKMRIRGRSTIQGDALTTDETAGDTLFFDFIVPGTDNVYFSMPLTHQGKRLPFLRPPA